ncbi:MAG: cyclic nucleotide-binding domain-containing protein, partial [Deltaproteobacteria bacterium]|nr:cyclic nucleotide-binding domain-containing protein [Deltaproteobacteria bacterium]
SVGELLTVPKGKNLIRRGAVDRDVYVVLSGEFDVRHGWGFSINRHRQGGMFGEMALVNNTPRSATVTALTEARVLRLPASELEPLMERYPGVAIALRRIADSRS